jgi:hypothetical protein
VAKSGGQSEQGGVKAEQAEREKPQPGVRLLLPGEAPDNGGAVVGMVGGKWQVRGLGTVIQTVRMAGRPHTI